MITTTAQFQFPPRRFEYANVSESVSEVAVGAQFLDGDLWLGMSMEDHGSRLGFPCFPCGKLVGFPLKKPPNMGDLALDLAMLPPDTDGSSQDGERTLVDRLL